jgi:hypothetical protein
MLKFKKKMKKYSRFNTLMMALNKLTITLLKEIRLKSRFEQTYRRRAFYGFW